MIEPASIFEIHRGNQPLIITMPHVGTKIPDNIRIHLNNTGLSLIDTDWHLERLYNFAKALDVTIIIAKFSRYVVDLNRPPDNQSLYPGQTTTSLCPLETFDGEPIYYNDHELTEDEISRRRELYWQPWHDCVQQELKRLKTMHGHVQLWDAHSIRSVLPLHFKGTLPDFNFGTNSGKSCALERLELVVSELSNSSTFTHVVNGRYKGGYITRHYGQPNKGIHAIQLELAQSSYMTELSPLYWDDKKADIARSVIKSALEHFLLPNVPNL
ncbi:N-formylglutamate deformylase [Psychromonas sp. RZ22]|uniref:N-formylglutamate deformylase n=1 Tax=Psychromonas algarum TaxID=2555643 RepID=UPI001067CC74|nr:N-formylglutamate deformylase [Psychromonas sp. RZ22]TEW56823.1 N-formylglutamate deformylase [Psychromonas sp. RZ22]